MNTTFSHVPPGFRFHPTDEELVDYYLKKKIASNKIDLDVIRDVDLYKIEPWDLQELCRIGNGDESDWYFFSHKDKKYPTGSRTNRATKAGFWKATGRDKGIYMRNMLVGMRKTLVFYQGRAPNGHRSDWIMHEYRLETNENGPPQEEGWAVCRVFKKRSATVVRRMGDYESPCWYDQATSSFMPQPTNQQLIHSSCKQEVDHHHLQYSSDMHVPRHHDPFVQLPRLESPNKQLVAQHGTYEKHDDGKNVMMMPSEDYSPLLYNDERSSFDDQLTDWRLLDKLVASQFSHIDDDLKQAASEETTANYLNEAALLFGDQVNESNSIASTSTHLWK